MTPFEFSVATFNYSILLNHDKKFENANVRAMDWFTDNNQLTVI